MSLPSNSNSLSILNVEFQRQLLIQRSTRSMRALQPGPLFTPSTGRVPHQLCHLRKIRLRPLQRAPKPLNAASSSPASPPAHGAQGQKDPFAERTVYNDNYFDRLFIKIYTKKIAAQLNGNASLSCSFHWPGCVVLVKRSLLGIDPLMCPFSLYLFVPQKQINLQEFLRPRTQTWALTPLFLHEYDPVRRCLRPRGTHV